MKTTFGNRDQHYIVTKIPKNIDNYALSSQQKTNLINSIQ